MAAVVVVVDDIYIPRETYNPSWLVAADREAEAISRAQWRITGGLKERSVARFMSISYIFS